MKGSNDGRYDNKLLKDNETEMGKEKRVVGSEKSKQVSTDNTSE
jgi:hypothetical protein